MLPKTQLKFTFGCIVFVLIIAGIYLLHEASEGFFSAGAILLSASLALIAALLNILYTRKTARESNSLGFQQYLLNDNSYKEYQKTIANVSARGDNLRALAKVENRFDNDAMAIKYVLNTWERAANAMRHGLYDELFLYEAHKSMVIYYGSYLRGFIEEAQQRQPTFYENFSWLVLKWTIRRDSFKEKQRKNQLRKIFRVLNQVASNQVHKS